MTDFPPLKSDGNVAGTALAVPEERAIPGEELWWPQGGSAGVVVTQQTALTYAAVLTVATVVATDTAILPLKVHQTMPDGSCREATEHANRELLCRSPNGESTPMKWRQSLMGHALFGNGYAEIQRLGNGKPYKLHLMNPRTTRAKRSAAGDLFYELAGTGKEIPAGDVLHVAGFGFDGITGYDMIRLMNQTIGLGIAEDTFAADFFENGSESGGVIELPAGRSKSPDADNELLNRWEHRHKGAGNRHKTALLPAGAKYTQTSTEPEKSQLLDSRRYQVLDTIRPWRVPPHKAGDFSQAHLANIEASNLDYLMTALMGWLVTIEQEFNLKLFTRAEWLAGYHVKHEVTELLRGDIKTRFETYVSAITNGLMSPNEARKKENMNPIPADKGGDLLTVQSQNVPLGSNGTPPETGAALRQE